MKQKNAYLKAVSVRNIATSQNSDAAKIHGRGVTQTLNANTLKKPQRPHMLPMQIGLAIQIKR